MADDQLHYPPGAEPNPPAPEPPQPPAPPAPETPAEPTPPEPPKADEDKGEKTDPPAEPPQLPKKRSVYDDLKDTRKEKNAFKDAAVAALEAQGVTLTGKETAEELQALAKKTPSAAPAEPPAPSNPADELESFAKENDIDPKSLERLTEIIANRLPNAQLTAEERQQLSDLKTWKEGKEAQDTRAAEDNEIRAQSPAVRAQMKELGVEVHDDAEFTAIVDEIVKLAHTAKYHDKELAYIVWAEKAALAKLVSPKKPSFEGGGPGPQGAPNIEPDFSSGSGITPEMVSRAQSKRANPLEILKSR